MHDILLSGWGFAYQPRASAVASEIIWRSEFGTWNKQCRSPRYMLRRPLLLLQEAVIKRVTVLLSGCENNWRIRFDLLQYSGFWNWTILFVTMFRWRICNILEVTWLCLDSFWTLGSDDGCCCSAQIAVSTLFRNADYRRLTGRCSSFDGVVLITGKRRCSEKHILETWSELNFRILNGIGAFTAGRQLFGSIVGFGMSVFVWLYY